MTSASDAGEVSDREAAPGSRDDQIVGDCVSCIYCRGPANGAGPRYSSGWNVGTRDDPESSASDPDQITRGLPLRLLHPNLLIRLRPSRFPQHKLLEGLIGDIARGLPVEVDIDAQTLNLRIECRGFQPQQPCSSGLVAIALSQRLANQFSFVVFNHVKKILRFCCRYHP